MQWPVIASLVCTPQTSIYIYTGWWFGAFFFHNIWDNPSHWLSCFSRLLKAPTSITILFFMAKEEETRGTKEETVFRKPEAHLDMVENGGHRCPPRPFWSDEIRHADPSAVEMTGWHCWTRLCRNVGTSKIDVKRSQDRPFLRYETPPNSKGQQRQKLLRGWPLHLRLGLLVAKKQGGTVGSAGCSRFPYQKDNVIVLRFHLQRSAQGSSNYSFVSRSYSLKCERSLRKMLLEHVKESLVTLFQVYPTRFTRNKDGSGFAAFRCFEVGCQR